MLHVIKLIMFGSALTVSIREPAATQLGIRHAAVKLTPASIHQLKVCAFQGHNIVFLTSGMLLQVFLTSGMLVQVFLTSGMLMYMIWERRRPYNIISSMHAI